MRIQVLLGALALAACLAAPDAAALPQRWSQTAVTNLWDTTTDDNWADFLPDPFFDDAAIIGSTFSGAAATASPAISGTIESPTVILGDGVGTDGTLAIGAGHSLTVIDDVSAGDVQVGALGGLGTLNVTGGTLAIGGQLASTSGAADSAINLFPGANVTAGSANFNRNVRFENGASFSTTTPNSKGTSLTFGPDGTHAWEIVPGGNALLSVAGNADLNGTLRLDFAGVTPVMGATYDLIDAASLDATDKAPSSFTRVVTSVDNALGAGERFFVNAVAGGSGAIARATLEQHPVLMIDRDTKIVTLANPGSTSSIGIDSYVISSAMGALTPGEFTGGFTQAQGWYDANLKPTAISELNGVGTTSLNPGATLNLGGIFAPAAPVFGQPAEDIVFRYSKPGTGFITGEIVYSGLPDNTLVLNVDPATGAAQLLNPTQFTVAIDSYTVKSEAGSLQFANGTWNSLDDQNASGGNWHEANLSATQVAELLVAGGMTLAPGDSVPLGTLFDTSGARDLQLSFSIVDASAGDFVGSGVVDGGDFLAWQRGHSPDPLSASDLAAWEGNFGFAYDPATVNSLLTGAVHYSTPLVSSAGALSVVPEPASGAALAVLFALAAVARSRAPIACRRRPR